MNAPEEPHGNCTTKFVNSYREHVVRKDKYSSTPESSKKSTGQLLLRPRPVLKSNRETSVEKCDVIRLTEDRKPVRPTHTLRAADVVVKFRLKRRFTSRSWMRASTHKQCRIIQRSSPRSHAVKCGPHLLMETQRTSTAEKKGIKH